MEVLDIVRNAYSKAGFELVDTFKVDVNKGIYVYINTENPFMGEKFGGFLEDIRNEIEKEFEVRRQGLRYIGNFAVLAFE